MSVSVSTSSHNLLARSASLCQTQTQTQLSPRRSSKGRFSINRPVLGCRGQPLCTCGCMKDVLDHSNTKFSNVSGHGLSFRDANEREENERRGSSQKSQKAISIAKKIEKDLKKKTEERVPFERVSVQIEIGKLKKLLAETINVITFAMCLPQLVENDYAIFRKHVPNDLVETAKTLLDPVNFKTCSLFSAGEYEFRRTNFFTESSASTVEKFYSEYKEKNRDFSPRKEVEDVWNAINLLYDKTREKLQLVTVDIKDKLPENIKELLETLEKLFNHVIEEMKRSPQEVERSEIELSRMFMSFEQQNNEMVTLHTQLRPAIEENLLTIMDVCQEVQSLKDQRRKLKEFLTNSHQRIRNNLEKNTMMYNLEAMKITKEKMGPRKELINKHQKLMKEDLAEEKAFRVKKYKVEQVLQGVINKYERDMNNRNAMLAHLNEMYEMEMAQMNRMQERYDAQETVYNLLMEEKAKYEQAAWEAKLKQIQRAIAARKIQRFYRGYLAFMQAHGKRKGKGKGKGKKR